jgi:hypothetical protein
MGFRSYPALPASGSLTPLKTAGLCGLYVGGVAYTQVYEARRQDENLYNLSNTQEYGAGRGQVDGDICTISYNREHPG